MRSISSAKLLIVFAVALSLASLPGPLSLTSGLPTIHLAHANVATNQPWVPAGPSMDTLTYPIFSDENAEFTDLQSATPSIDFVDWPLDPGIIPGLTASPNFQVTAPISDTGYFELQFHMGNNFWGCQFNFGNAACGTHIRQAFAHGVDKGVFITTELAGNAQAIDNPVPPSVDLNTPDPCGYDVAHVQTGAGCIVNGAGGTAYHLDSPTGTGSVNCPGATQVPQFAWTPHCGTQDFCAAADHLVAAGLATGKAAGTCVLTGVQPAVAGNIIHLFIRSDNTPRLHVGDSYAQFICALFTGSFSTGCSGTTLVADHGSILQFPGFTTSTTTVSLSWWVYTAGFGNVLTFDSSLYFGYNSQFVSGIPSIKSPSGPCNAGAVPSFAPGNYMYICNSSYDTNISNAEFAPCLTNAGDPTTGQTRFTVTFANCPASSSPTAASAAYHAQEIFGQNAYTIPWWSGKNQFAYLSGWQRGILHKGNGLTPPGNFFLTLNAYNPAPAVAGTIRQGFKQGTSSVNPFIGNTVWDAGVIGSIWDGPGAVNPDSPQAYLDWMTVKTDQLSTSALSYTPPPGTTAAFRYTLRNDIFYHTGQKVTAWDLAFTYAALKANGVNGALVGSMTGVKVLSSTQVDVDVNAVGPFTKLFLSAIVLPARDWVNTSVCSASTWDTAASNPNFAAANAALTTCIAPAASVTASGVITGTQSNVDSAKVQPTYDPVATGNLIGSGAFQCKAGSVIGGPGCSSSGTQSPPAGGQWTLTRYGVGTTPGGSLNTYFRSAGNLALWVWSQDRGVFSTDFLNFGVVSLCFGKPIGSQASCNVFQHGIGAPGGSAVVGLTQVSIVQRFVGVNWVAPYDIAGSPPQNMVAFPPVLHEGTVTLNPCNIDPVNGYDC